MPIGVLSSYKQSVDFMLHFAFLLVLLCFSSASSNDVGLWLIGKF